MFSRDKLIIKFLENPQSFRFKKIKKVLIHLKFRQSRISGSHHLYVHTDLKDFLTIPIHKNDCKPIYKFKIAKFIKDNFPDYGTIQTHNNR